MRYHKQIASRSSLLGLLTVVLLDQSTVDAFHAPHGSIRQKAATQLQVPSWRQQSAAASACLRLAARSEDDDEEKQTGMEEAFRQLEALDSLRDKKEETTVKLDEQSKAQLKAEASSAETASLEEEVKLFKGMLQDSEKDESDLYSDVIKDIGGTPKAAAADEEEKPETEVWIQEKVAPTSSSSEPTIVPSMSEEDTQKFMDQAIQEALDEAKSMAPDGKKLSDSILDDEEIMKEIEEIFEKGNEKLLASLEEIREEQRALAKVSAEQRSKVALDNMADDDTAERLAQAEASMEKQLTRVDKERAEVEKAVADLQRVKAELDADPLMKLSSNIFKPAALAGVLLFTARSALDFLAMSAGGIDAEAHLTAALIQGAIALICAAYLLFF